METKDKQKLVEYLYPTDQLMNFMCNDLYQELLCLMPKSLYLSTKNLSGKIRKQNFQKVKQEIVKFILTNLNYKTELFKHYKHTMISPILYDVIVGLTFYIASTSDKYQDVDIFKDKKSVCCGVCSILNFI